MAKTLLEKQQEVYKHHRTRFLRCSHQYLQQTVQHGIDTRPETEWQKQTHTNVTRGFFDQGYKSDSVEEEEPFFIKWCWDK